MDTKAAVAGAGLRGARALVLASVTLLTSAGAHVAGGGGAPSPTALVALLGALTLVSAPLLRQPASARRIMLLLLGGQGVLHVALSIGSSGPMPEMSHAAHASAAGGVLAGLEPLSSALVPDTATGLLMAEAHLVATLVLGLWLAAGERALWTVLTLAVRPVAAALGVLLSPAPSAYDGPVDARCAGVPVVDQRAIRLWAPTCRAVTRRGPPRGPLCALVA